jgi:hypothetical protein
MMLHRPRGGLPPWVPAVDAPNALTAPRGGWLLEIEAQKRRNRTSAPEPSGGLALGLPAQGFSRTRSTGDMSGGRDAQPRSGQLAAQPALPRVAPLFGDGIPPMYDSDESGGVVAPSVSVHEEEGDTMRLDQVLQGEWLCSRLSAASCHVMA